METYVSLINGEGKAGSNEAAIEAIEAAGCKEVGTYMLMGQYDILLIIEAPDAISAATAIWKARKAAGDAAGTKSQTMRAFTVEEMEKMQLLAQTGD